VRTEGLDPVAARSAHPKTGRLLDFIIIGIPIGIDAAVAAGHIEILARVAAQTGEPDRAIAILEKALSMLGLGWNIPIPLRPALLHLDPMFDPLRNDPRLSETRRRHRSEDAGQIKQRSHVGNLVADLRLQILWQRGRVRCHRPLTKTVLRFVSPVVSPGCLKMGKLLITRDDCNHYSRYSDTISLRTADDISEF